MKITLEQTTQIHQINGVPARLWEGKTESGIEIQVLITRIAVHNSQDCSQFERELQEQRPPSPNAQAFPLRMVL